MKCPCFKLAQTCFSLRRKTFHQFNVVLSQLYRFRLPECDAFGFVSSRKTGDASIAGDAYPVDAPVLTPLSGSSCDSTSLSTDFVKMPIGQWYSTFLKFIYNSHARFHNKMNDSNTLS